MYLFNQNIYPVVLIELDFPDIPGLVLLQKFQSHALNTEKAACGAILLEGGPSGRSCSKSLNYLKNYKMFNGCKPIKPIHLTSITHEKSYNEKYLI